MFQKYLRIAIFSVVATYLASLAIGCYWEAAYDFFYTDPIKELTERKDLEHSHKDIEEGVRKNLYFFNYQRDSGKGVVAYEEGRTYGDYTFFFSSFDKRGYLLDLKGKVVHQWILDPGLLFGDRGNPEFPDAVWRAFMQPNGDVVGIYCGMPSDARAFQSKGIFRIDKDSKIIWHYRGKAHHDVVFLPDGNMLTLLDEPRQTAYPGAYSLPAPFSVDAIATLNPQGKLISKITILDLLANSPQKKFLEKLGTIDNPRYPNGDLFHTNTMTPVTAAAAARNPALKEGDILLSFRNYDLLAVVDLEKKAVVWASYGPWKHQHNPEFLSDGTVVMFDNLGNIGKSDGLSRVLNVDLASGEVLWEYGGSDSYSLFGPVSSSVDPLPNGSFLVTETGGGRIFEVTRDKQVVWDYRAPQRIKSQRGATMIPNLFGGWRYRKDELSFLNAGTVDSEHSSH